MRWLYLILPGLLVVGLLVLAGCKTVPVQYDFVTAHQEALDRVLALPTLLPDSEEERQAVDRVKRFLGDFSEEIIRETTTQVYSKDAYLNDTLKTVQGAEAIQAYFLEAAEMTDFISVTFADVSRTSDGCFIFRWTMDIGMQKVAKGKNVRTLGMSLIRFNDERKVNFHQDYWDSTAGLFQHVPGIGRGIRIIKARL
jgi:hypothetical protein